MKNFNNEFKLWAGDDIYYVDNSKVISTYVVKVDFKMTVSTIERQNAICCEYTLQNGTVITEKDIDVIYFTDKKALIQKLISEL